jgi:hypothetical protein
MQVCYMNRCAPSFCCNLLCSSIIIFPPSTMNPQKGTIIDLTYEDDNQATFTARDVPVSNDHFPFDDHLLIADHHRLLVDDYSMVDDHLLKLQSALQSSARGATFSCGGMLMFGQQASKGDLSPRSATQVSDQLALFKPVTIRFGSQGAGQTLTLPTLTDSDHVLQSLLSYCEPAIFGRNGQNILDESYRRATKLDTTEFVTDFSPYEAGIMDIVTQLLLPGVDPSRHGIRAELYKLNAYSGPYGHFKAHVDTPRSVDQIGSLVVCLPVVFEGRLVTQIHVHRANVTQEVLSLSAMTALNWFTTGASQINPHHQFFSGQRSIVTVSTKCFL